MAIQLWLANLDNWLEWVMTQGLSLSLILLMNAAALVVALVQVGQARDAAAQSASSAELSAASAADAWKALASQTHLASFVDACAHAREIQDAVDREDWGHARLRADDLRQQLARLSGSLQGSNHPVARIEKALAVAAGQIRERAVDPNFPLTEDLGEALTLLVSELNKLVGKSTYSQGGVTS